MKLKMSFLALSLFTLGIGINPANSEPHCRPCPYSCDDLGLGRKDCSEISSSRGVCCVDLSSKGYKLAQAQDSVLANSQPSRSQDRCPPGFSPSEQKCSQNERRRGCKDIRLPSGLGCVNR